MQVQEINIQNMNVELVAQMFKNYRSNVLFHLEGRNFAAVYHLTGLTALVDSYGQSARTFVAQGHNHRNPKRQGNA